MYLKHYRTVSIGEHDATLRFYWPLGCLCISLAVCK